MSADIERRAPHPVPLLGVVIALGFIGGIVAGLFLLGGPDEASGRVEAPPQSLEHDGADGPPSAPETQPPTEEPADLAPEEEGEEAADAVADPVRIEIPSIGVDYEIVPVGLRPDGAMDVPDFGLAGWYTEGPRPGEEGPATVVGHRDSQSGPDVFHRLDELAPGDEVHIHRADGSSVTFVMDEAERVDKDALPEERIWGWTDEPTLRLITCDGFFNKAVGHYDDNLIIYLSLADD